MFFCEYSEIFKKAYFEGNMWTAASEKCKAKLFVHEDYEIGVKYFSTITRKDLYKSVISNKNSCSMEPKPIFTQTESWNWNVFLKLNSYTRFLFKLYIYRLICEYILHLHYILNTWIWIYNIWYGLICEADTNSCKLKNCDRLSLNHVCFKLL